MKIFSPIFILVTLFANWGNSFAQTPYSKYLNETCEWNTLLESFYYDFDCNDFALQRSFLRNYLQGDTLINGITYYKLYTERKDSTFCSGTVTTDVNTYFNFGIREDSINKIYKTNLNGPETVFWDFNISTGDIIDNNCQISFIDTLWLGDTPLKKYVCSCDSTNYVIEGVGCHRGFLSRYFCSTGIESNTNLLCYQKDGYLIDVAPPGRSCELVVSSEEQTKVKNEGEINIYPNPARDIIFVNSGSEIDFIEIYDYLGRLMLSRSQWNFNNGIDLNALPSGAYLLLAYSGEKRIVKRIMKL